MARSAVLLADSAVCAAAVRAADVNVLLVTIDTLRTDRLSCYSSKFLQTPRIDALAARGPCSRGPSPTIPITLASHTNILLGLTPPAHGVSENSKSVVPDEFLSLAELLKAQGYATGAFVGSFSLDSRFGLDQGFDVYDDAYPSKPAAGYPFSERPAEKTLAAARSWLDGQKGKWFCWVHLWDPHAPYEPPEPYASQFKNDPYSGEVAYVDAELGKLFDWLDAHGGLGQTLVVLTADHGESLGEHGEIVPRLFRLQFDDLGAPHHRRTGGHDGGPGQGLRQPCGHLSDRLRRPRPQGPCGASGGFPVPVPQGPDEEGPSRSTSNPSTPISIAAGPPSGDSSGTERSTSIRPSPSSTTSQRTSTKRRTWPPARTSALTRSAMRRPSDRTAWPAAAKQPGTSDREVRERLRSLGYVASPVTQTKASYGPEDDLKTLLPFEQKIDIVRELRSSRAGGRERQDPRRRHQGPARLRHRLLQARGYLRDQGSWRTTGSRPSNGESGPIRRTMSWSPATGSPW